MNSSNCIFCKIVAGEIPAAVVYDDSRVLAFLDTGPIHPGHTLVIPKTHADTLHTCPPESLQAVSQILGRLAAAVVKATQCDGYNCLCNNGRVAGQSVDHVHFHIIPRFAEDGFMQNWPAQSYAEGQMSRMAAEIKKKLE